MKVPVAEPIFIPGLSALSPRYRLILCDIWGVVHGGVRAFPAAVDALTRFREAGGHVIMVSNAPRPFEGVAQQLRQFGFPDDAYDSILTSGDLSRAFIAAKPGVPVYHLGPPRDLPLFEGLDAPMVALAEADYVVCSGLFDDTTETPQTYAESLRFMLARGLTMLCANPDLVVHRAGELIYCAGALGVAYEELGGNVIYAGKPYPDVYKAALQRVAHLGLTANDTLAIGDSIRTDISGAHLADIDSLFIVTGIHGDEVMPEKLFSEAGVSRWIAEQAAKPDFVAEFLAW